jgi:hypothetical protein
VANRAYLLSLPFPPYAFGDPPASGTVAFAKHSLPFFWASLFDETSIVGPFLGGLHGLAAPLHEAAERSARRLQACAAHFGRSTWPLAERWLAFLRCLEQPWIAVDAHDLDLDGPRLEQLLLLVDIVPTEPAFVEEFGALDFEDTSGRAIVLAGVDRDGASPPAPPPTLRELASSASPSPSSFSWDVALTSLLGESDPAAWARYFPDARPAPFRPDVAVAGPGAYLWYSQPARAWTVLWASCEHAAMEVFGVPPSNAVNEIFPPLPADVVGLDDPPLTYERLVDAAQELGDPVAPGRAPRPLRPPFETLVDQSTITYFDGAADAVKEPYAILFRGAPTATPWS